MGKMLLGLITFLAAFLLFQIELIIAKVFLPNYGGSYIVWGACIVFFQAILLLGYWFAHQCIELVGVQRYRVIHLALLAGVLIFFPGKELDVVFANSSLPLVVDVFLRLTLNIGPVFFVLSTMSITTQMWLANSKLPARLNPYALYAVSNVGSFVALLSYPFVVELFLDIPQQLMIWRGLYFILIILNVLAFMQVPMDAEVRTQKASAPIERSVWLRWLLLGAGGSMIFLSVNSLITYELPPVPLFWIFPLGIYLLSFVLNFKKDPWCPEWIYKKITPLIGFAVVYYFLVQKLFFPALFDFFVFLGLLFVLCMYCQHELICSKPSDERKLSAFYLFISLGSFLGGVAVTWIAPLTSLSMVEYIWSLIVIALLIQQNSSQLRITPYFVRIIIYFNVFLIVWAAYFVKYNFFGIVLLMLVVWKIFTELSKARYVVFLCLIVLMTVMLPNEYLWDVKATKQNWKHRNYYGICQTVDQNNIRWLYHGNTLHGAQSLSSAERSKPLSYYGPHSGAWEIMRSSDFHFSKVGLIGLGTGTMTSFLNKDQTVDIFELDPDIYKIAMEKFTFLKDCAASQRLFFGDARISLTQIHDRVYDLLIIDAFGGDAIPVHLLTKNVFEEYRKHLSPHGMIMIHVSNRYVKLVPVLAKIAPSVGADFCYRASKGGGLYTGSEWMIITWDHELYRMIKEKYRWEGVSLSHYQRLRLWTDGYSSVLPVVRLEYLLNAVKNFQPFRW